jgi:hypothetical protein
MINICPGLGPKLEGMCQWGLSMSLSQIIIRESEPIIQKMTQPKVKDGKFTGEQRVSYFQAYCDLMDGGPDPGAYHRKVSPKPVCNATMGSKYKPLRNETPSPTAYDTMRALKRNIENTRSANFNKVSEFQVPRFNAHEK